MGTENVAVLTPNPGPMPAGRKCSKCGALLSRNNRLALCAPCNGGDWDPPTDPHPAAAARIEYERGLEAA